jgi:predicted RNA-binding protein with TRAM domain
VQNAVLALPQAARGEGLRFADGSVGFVTMKESGKKVPVEVVRTEKQLAFTNFESHETLCSIKL